MAIQRKKIEGELLKNAMYDSLTVLPNQSLFVSYLEKAAERASREKDFAFAVIAMDLDNFKLVNDFHGYTMGDEALLLLARRLNGFLREKDTLARMDGDEFAILVQGVKKENEARKIAESLHKTISKPITLNDFQVNLSAGIGICLSASGFEKPIDLLRNAETAMYRAKEKGQAGTAMFDAHMRDRSIARLNLESKLSQAIENKEFVVNYQPIVSIETSSIVGFEALVRWKQNTGSLIAASEFISLAEDTQFIFAIDMIVMQAACRQLKAWQRRFKSAESLWVSVNLSSRHIANRELIGAVQQVLEESNLTANCLNLEFTEKTLMEENGESIVVINQLREIGVQLSIDDFGTGYSSLSYLRRFPVNFIKLDRSFTIEEDWEIATLITDLAHKLELKVIAEGVEQQAQLAQLREIHCDLAQGNLFSTEVNPEKAETLLAGEGKLERV
jgi:diguanylate cyclase (GGDEF)-like protein